jgi:hypothetical protein
MDRIIAGGARASAPVTGGVTYRGTQPGQGLAPRGSWAWTPWQLLNSEQPAFPQQPAGGDRSISMGGINANGARISTPQRWAIRVRGRLLLE